MNGDNSLSRRPRSNTAGGSRRAAVVSLAIACSIAGIGAAVRSVAVWEKVFTDQGVRLQNNDPWYHLRRVQYQVRHFPAALDVDVYGLHPSPQPAVVAPLPDLLISGIATVLFGKAATDVQVAAVCALAPPLASILAAISVYLVGLMVCNRRCALVAAAILAVCPSLFFLHSLLGAADHHVWEVLWSTAFVAAILVVASRAERGVNESVGTYPLLVPGGLGMQLLAGVLLAFYLMTWVGGVYFLAIVGAWVLVRHVVRHFHGQDSRDTSFLLIWVACAAILLILLMSGPYPMRRLQLCGLLGVGVLPILLQLFSKVLQGLRIGRFWFVPALVVLVLIAAAGLRLLAPGYFSEGFTALRLFAGGPKGETVGEVASIFRKGGLLSLGPVWTLFATGFPLACVGWIVCVVRVVRYGRTGDILLAVWSAITFASMAGQGRFAYYASVNVALLVGILVDAVFAGILAPGPRKKSERPDRTPMGNRAAVATAAGVATRGRALGRRLVQGGLMAWTLALAFVPGLWAMPAFMRHFDGPSQGWMSALEYLRNETPEPFGDPAAYFTPAASRRVDASSQPNDRSYGVLSWWDYGYWITAVARRVPCANPTQAGAGEAARFFTATEEVSALQFINALGARYIVIDWAMAAQLAPGDESTNSKFDAMAVWADRPLEDYYERFLLQADDDAYVPVYLYYPAYFRSMAARLYAFGGGAVSADRVLVVQFARIEDRRGRITRTITNLTAVGNYDEALTMIAELPANTAALVSDNPYASCVPLSALSHIEPVFDSSSLFVAPDGITHPEVRVFAYDSPASTTSE